MLSAGLWQCSCMHIVAKTGGLVRTYPRLYPCLRLFMSLSSQLPVELG